MWGGREGSTDSVQLIRMKSVIIAGEGVGYDTHSIPLLLPHLKHPSAAVVQFLVPVCFFTQFSNDNGKYIHICIGFKWRRTERIMDTRTSNQLNITYIHPTQE